MAMIMRPALGSLLLSIFVGLIASGSSHAASLRCSSGQKTVVRPAVYAEPVQELEEIFVEEPMEIAGESFVESPGYGGPDCCGAPAVSACGPCWSDLRWVEFDYLLMWHKGRWFPALARAGSADTNAQVVFGEDRVADEPHSGGRLEIGTWLDPCRTFGMGAHLVAFGEAPVQLSLAAGAFAYIDRPFIDNFPPGGANEFVVANGGTTQGSLDIVTDSDIRGFDVFGKTLLWRTCDTRIDGVFGYVHSRIDENLAINTFTSPTPGLPAFPTLDVRDLFATENEYSAGLIGLTGNYRRGPWGLELFARFGFGNMRQRVAISGSTITNDGQTAPVTARGLLAQPTNSGIWVQDDFSFMEDVGFKLAWYPRERVKVSLGYNLMYWSSVARPGNHIDVQNNSGWFTGDPATPFPRFLWNPSDLFIHGMTAGIEYKF